MFGMQQMIKELTGVDPEELQGMIAKAQTDGAQILSQLFTRLEALDAKCNLILENQQTQYALLRKAGLIEDANTLAQEPTNEHRAADKH